MKQLDDKKIAYSSVMVLGLLMIPLLLLSLYAVPWYDDYNFGGFVKGFIEQERSLGSMISGALYCAKTQWYAWQGTFSSIFFMSIVPCIWGEEYYFIGPLFLILLLAVALFTLCESVCTNVFGAKRFQTVPVCAVLTTMGIELLYSLHDGIYWYNAGVHYVGMHSFFFLLAAGWFGVLYGSGKWKGILCMIWGILAAPLAGGANYVTALQGSIMVASLFVLGLAMKKKRKRVIWLAPSLLIYGFSLFKNISAPGNRVRTNALAVSRPSVVQTVFSSFKDAYKYSWVFTGWITVLFLILMIPLIWKMVTSSSFSFRFPVLVSAWSVCFYAAGFAPGIYALGQTGLPRMMNAIKLTFQVLLVFNEIYWIGWIRKKVIKGKKTGEMPIWYYLIIAGIMCVVIAIEPDRSMNYASLTAIRDLVKGDAKQYHDEYKERVELLKTSDKQVILHPYTVRPWALMETDLTEDPSNGANRAIAGWYHKDSVICIQKGK